ncbi:MAG: protein translocase subunit SecD [Elusimicrobia bacterium]|nr:protein translocase subunit SecD [Elusimicrobiota bacterium]
MSKNLKNRLLIIAGVFLGAILFMTPLDKRINLGLDLKGGMHLVLRVDTSALPEKARNDAVLRAIEILRNRIDSLGAGEMVVQRQGEDQILLQIPGVTDREKAVEMVKRVAHLEFRLVSDDADLLKKAVAGEIPPGYELKYARGDRPEALLVESNAVMQGDAVADAMPDTSSLMPRITLRFKSDGARQFAELTQANVDRRLAIVLDGEVLSAPNIREPILSGDAEISGDFTYDEASVLALALRSGSLPAPMHIEEERTIGPLLGMDSISSGVRATLVGTGAVVLFMASYYLLGGVIASLALVLNLLLTIGVMGFLNVMLPQSPMTLTLPGIAGLALTLGMAVDANILINERIREEIDIGRPLSAAVNAGYDRALSAIIDSNLTTLIAAAMLFYFGSGPIKGFAVTLTIGLLASLFTAVFVTRTFFLFLIEKNVVKTLKMARIVGETKFNFINKAPFFLVLSAAIIAWGITTIVQKKDQAFGIDFAGGQVQEYHFASPVEADAVRAALKSAGIADAVIQQFANDKHNVIIRTGEDTYEKVQTTLKESFADNSFETLRIEKVGPVVGKHLRQQAILAMLLALAGIMIYVAFRFRHWDFGAAGVIALLHDVVISMGLLVLMGRQIDLLVVTALLTIAGYSINDTIVIYDRVRENINQKGKKMSLADVLNLSLNQTLGRTILTSLSTSLVVVSLFFLGGEVLNAFALTLLIGFIVGAYSTIYIVSPLVLLWNNLQKKAGS